MPNKETRRVTQAANKVFLSKLKNAPQTKKVETEVIAPAYRDVIESYYCKDAETSWDYDANTDGFFVSKNLFYAMYLLLEAKDDLNLLEVNDRARVVIQCVYYMKKFEQTGHPQPTVLFGGDRDQMFVVYAPPLLHYLKDNHDWSIAPSNAYRQNPELLAELAKDPILTTFVYDIHDSSFDVNDVFIAIDSMAENAGEYSKVKIIPQNIRVVYDEFMRTLSIQKSDIDLRDSVHLFISSLLGPYGQQMVGVDLRAKGRIHLGDKILKLDDIAYNAFFSRYEKTYTQQEIDAITSMYDILFEETQRRYSGDYWTPTIWADRAHELLAEELGNNWKQEYVVWDAACGTKNLTRDYKFKELYTSTIDQSELAISGQYNPEGAAFQYDFLNNDIDIAPHALFGDLWKMPQTLYRALIDNRPIVFLMNPPYGTGANDGPTSKAGIANTAVNKLMIHDKLNKAAQQPYAQFLYRIMKLKRDFGLSNVVIAFFTNERFLRGGDTWMAFLAAMQQEFCYRKGVFFQANEFANVSPLWGISFTIWRSGDVRKGFPADVFPLSVERVGRGGIEHIEDRIARSIPQTDFLSTWVKEPVAKMRDYQDDETYIRVSNAFEVNDNKSGQSVRLLKGALGYAHNNANDVEHSSKYVGIYSTAFGSGHGYSVLPENFDRACANFMIRKCIPTNWIIGHENFRRPSDELQETPEWAEFVSDAIIFALSNTSGSNQAALRGIEYKNSIFDVDNEWFFLSRKKLETLTETYGFYDLAKDLRQHPGERYCYTRLQGLALSDEAQSLYSILERLVYETFPIRESAHFADLDRCLQAWDAGFWQLYLAAQEARLPIIGDYREAFEVLRQKAEDRVYSWGLL